MDFGAVSADVWSSCPDVCSVAVTERAPPARTIYCESPGIIDSEVTKN